MCSFRAFWLLLAFLCVDVAIAQSRVNVYVADPRGGRGDVAANFLMARRLKELRPDADIRILVPRQSLDISKFLEPSLQNEAGFTEDGVKVIFYAPGTAVPPADVVVSYSVSGDPVSENIADSAPFVLMFLEPEVAARDPIRGAGWNSKEEPTLVKTVFFETGVGNAGLYVSPFARPAESFDQLQDRLSRETNMNPRSLPDLSRGFLAFGYSSSSDINRAYIEQILEIAKNAYKRRGD